MISKKEWAGQIAKELHFLSNMSALKSSWIEGNGPYSAGYSEEMCTLFDDLNLSELFIPEAKSMNLSDQVVSALNETVNALNAFDGEEMLEKDILAHTQWQMCMKLMAKAATLLESELDLVPDIPLTEKI